MLSSLTLFVVSNDYAGYLFLFVRGGHVCRKE